jgi:hypothetical protein
MTRKVLALVALLGLAAAGYAAEVDFTANLFGTRNDPGAGGFIVWHQSTSRETLTVLLWDVTASDGGAVFIDGNYVGYMDLVDGAGSLRVDGNLPRVQPGSTVLIVSPDQRPPLPLLTGTFRNQ